MSASDWSVREVQEPSDSLVERACAVAFRRVLDGLGGADVVEVTPVEPTPTAASSPVPGAPSRSEVAWRPPKAIDKYRIVRLIGRGAMGAVYLARDEALERFVAVKFICGIDPAPAAKDRFLVEARAAARLQHPNVVTIYSVSELHGRPYLVTEYVQGKRLDEIPKPADGTRVLKLGIGLASGLAAAHRKDVLHRDIKPSNAIVADDGMVKLLDFGLAKLLDGSPAPIMRSSASPTPPEMPRRSSPSPSSVCDAMPSSNVASRMASSNTTLRPLTDASALMGTPDYMAPEIWGGRSATARSDVYSLGVVLFELCTGHTPHRDVPRRSLPQIVQHRDAPLLTELAPAVNAKLAAVIARCLQRDPVDRFASGAELLAALKQIERAGVLPEGNPYRGIHAFEAEHRPLFHGRSAESGTVLDRLRVEPLVIVTGDSGVGKSSLCRAGVLPAVTEGAFKDGRAWSVVRLVPGGSPLLSLGAALAPMIAADDRAVVGDLCVQPDTLARSLSERLGRDAGFLLFVDQLEELITMSDAEGAASVAVALGCLAKGLPGVRVLMAVRSDFLARIAALPGLGDAMARALYLLRPLSSECIREAILGPAQVSGVTFESEALVETLVTSTSQSVGGLPLLQLALAELWEAHDRAARSIGFEELGRMGGVAGALKRYADKVLLGMTAVQRGAARRILTLLVSPQGAPARRREDELVADDPAARKVLDSLVAGRLLVARETEQGGTYELAHEVLLKTWGTLQRWLVEQADSRAVRERLATSAAAWERRGRDREALWNAKDLDVLRVVEPDDLGQRELAFVAASRDKVWKAKLARRIVLAVLLVVGIAAAFVSGWSYYRHAPDHRVTTLVQEAQAALTAARRDEQAQLADETDDDYQRAGQALESALLLDAGNADLQAQLGDVLYARALLADRQHHLRQRDELLHRLALYDADGVRRRLWQSTGQAHDSEPSRRLPGDDHPPR